MRPSFLLLLVVPLAWAAPRPAPGDEAPPLESRLHEALVALTDRDAAVRLEALDALGQVVAEDAEAAGRALPRLRQLLQLRTPPERAKAVDLLLRLQMAEARELWLERLDPAVEPDETVLAAAVAATGDAAADRDLQRLLLARIRDERTSDVARALALEAFGGLEGPAVDLVLRRARPGEPWVETCGRALGLGRRPKARAVDPLLGIWAGAAEVAPRISAWESLARVTRQGLGFDLDAWRAWWRASEKAEAARKAGVDEDGRYATPPPPHVPHYYGIPIQRPASHVVFCLDVSQSMYGTGIESARRELRRTLMEFPSTHAFEIIAFNAKVMPWADRLVRAHPVQKCLAMRWLEAIDPTNYTNLYDAVETAMGHAGRGARPVAAPVRLDAIFLLSDGAPNRGRHRTHKRIVEGLARMSRREIPVHTIGAGEEVFPLLKAIARATGGSFVDAFE